MLRAASIFFACILTGLGLFPPQPIVARLNAEVSRAVDSPEVAPKLRELYVRTPHTPPEQMPLLIAATAEAFGGIIKAAGIKPLD